jgi:hypothetical protein
METPLANIRTFHEAGVLTNNKGWSCGSATPNSRSRSSRAGGDLRRGDAGYSGRELGAVASNTQAVACERRECCDSESAPFRGREDPLSRGARGSRSVRELPSRNPSVQKDGSMNAEIPSPWPRHWIAGAMIVVAACSGCTGTLRSRAVLDSGCRFGWPIFGAIADDVDMIVHGDTSGCRGDFMRPMAFFSLPLDLVFDITLLPVDLCAGLLGHTKQDQYPREGELVSHPIASGALDPRCLSR